MNPYVDNEGYLCLRTTIQYGMEFIEEDKRYKVNKEGLFEEVTN